MDEKPKEITELEKLENKLETINKILNDLQQEKEQLKEDNETRKKKINDEWRKKVKEKYRKEEEKKQQIEKQRRIQQHWEMLKWVTNYINENQDNWEQQRKQQQLEIEMELQQWDKLKRLEKIEKLKEKWEKTFFTK